LPEQVFDESLPDRGLIANHGDDLGAPGGLFVGSEFATNRAVVVVRRGKVLYAAEDAEKKRALRQAGYLSLLVFEMRDLRALQFVAKLGKARALTG
jgi:hypothetical protein